MTFTGRCVVAFLLAALSGPLAAASAPGRAPAPAAAPAFQPFDTRSAQALLIDWDTGSILFAKAADQAMSPGGLTKLMTMAVVFEALKTGRLRLDEAFTVSEGAWRKGGAPSGGPTMFASIRSTIKVRDLMRGAIVQGANDACLVLAEGMAGSEANFVSLMNVEAARLGLARSRFVNATGAADAAQTVTASDLARLVRHLIQDYPEYYAIYREPAFTWGGFNQTNKNPLIPAGIGADGLIATGSDQAGFAMAASVVRDGQRLIMVINGVATDKDRTDEARKLIDWGYRTFENVRLFAPGDVIGEANVFGGDRPTVALVTRDSLSALMPRTGRDAVKGRVVYQGPVPAPIAKGQPIGTLELSLAGQVIRQAPLYAAADVASGSLPQRAYDGVRELLFGWW